MSLGYIVTIKDSTNISKNKITIIDNYISAIDANRFIDFFNSNKSFSEYSTNYGAQDFSTDAELFDLLRKYEKKVSYTHKNINQLKIEIYPYAALGFKWQDGWSQHAHIDAVGPGESIEYSAVIYLNDNYEGGEIYFPAYDVCIKPQAGDLVCFPDNEKFVHGVKPILSGTRYTSPRWFTRIV